MPLNRRGEWGHATSFSAQEMWCESARRKREDVMAELKRQHYVTRAYLASWAPDGLVWVKRGSSMYSTDPTNVAVKSWCYEVSTLNEMERNSLEDFLRVYCRNCSPEFIAGLLELADGAKTSDDERKVSIEQKIGMVEAKFLPLSLALQQDDFTPLKMYDGIKTIMSYIVLQYYRTLAYEDLVKRQKFDGLTTDQVERFIGYVRFALACSDANRMVAEMSEWSIAIVKAGGGSTFITGDNPVVSLESNDNCDHLYFPLSPIRALVLSRGVDMNVRNGCVLTDSDVLKYNNILRGGCLNALSSHKGMAM